MFLLKFLSLGKFKKQREVEKVNVMSIAAQGMAKLKFKKIITDRKKERERRRSTMKGLGGKDISDLLPPKPKPKLRLDHRKYGAWYLKPDDWENRFQRKHKKSVVAECVHKREPRYPEESMEAKKKDRKNKEALKKLEQEDDTSKEAIPIKEELDDEELSEVRPKRL